MTRICIFWNRGQRELETHAVPLEGAILPIIHVRKAVIETWRSTLQGFLGEFPFLIRFVWSVLFIVRYTRDPPLLLPLTTGIDTPTFDGS